MIKRKKTNNSNNVFTSIVRDVVEEQLTPVKSSLRELTNKTQDLTNKTQELTIKVNVIEKRMDNLDERMYSVEDNVKKAIVEYSDKILTGQDQIMGELQTIRQEQTMHQGQHDDLNSLPDRVETLEKIHPHGQHAQI